MIRSENKTIITKNDELISLLYRYVEAARKNIGKK
jgi:hypothetical protein